MAGGSSSHQLGLAAEEIALSFCLRGGARLLAQRWRCREGEIDLVLEEQGEIVFVEVKARRTHDNAAEAISPRQWRRIGAAARQWLAINSPPDAACRFDVVLVDRTGMVRRIRNAAGFDDW